MHRKRIGIIGGLGALGAADLFFKLLQATPSTNGRDAFELIFEQRPFDEPDTAGACDASLTARKLYVFDMIRYFEMRHADLVLLPCFISHTFLGEIAGEVMLPVLDFRPALIAHLQRDHPEAKRIGILTSDRVRQAGIFEEAFGAVGLAVVQPDLDSQRNAVMPAIYGAHGIKSGRLHGDSVDLLESACRGLIAQGAEVIVPGFTEIAIVVEALRERGLPIVDSNRAYARQAASRRVEARKTVFKVGVVGGVGPAATADFMQKVVRNTPASRDQDHIKLLVEQNPQIPDRTAHLVADGPDPTVALYATCKRLEAGGADVIAIPCNTAHAFVARIQPHLSIPIVNMLHETLKHLRQTHPACLRAGLLATDGTLASHLYQDAFEAEGLQLILPNAANQARVMEAIYGAEGVKAGFTTGKCRERLLQAMGHLAEHGAQAMVLGCTELPLILEQSPDFPIAGTHIVLLDPTDILARRCVALARPRPVVEPLGSPS